MNHIGLRCAAAGPERQCKVRGDLAGRHRAHHGRAHYRRDQEDRPGACLVNRVLPVQSRCGLGVDVNVINSMVFGHVLLSVCHFVLTLLAIIDVLLHTLTLTRPPLAVRCHSRRARRWRI